MKTSLFYLSLIVSILLNSSFALTLPKTIQECLETARISEDNHLYSPDGGLKLIKDYLKINWRSVLDEFETVAPTDFDKRKIVLACESLDDEEYVSFLYKIQNLFSHTRISMNVVETALNPSTTRQHFIAANSNNPEIRSLMREFRNLIPNNHYLKSYPDEVLSGQAKRRLDELNRENGTSGPKAMPFSKTCFALENSTEKSQVVTPTHTASRINESRTTPRIVEQLKEITSPFYLKLLLPLSFVALFLIGVCVYHINLR